MALHLNTLSFVVSRKLPYSQSHGRSITRIRSSRPALMCSTLTAKTKDVVTHSMAPEKVEIFRSLETWAEQNVLIHLKPVDKSWQPTDFLPESETSEGFYEQVKELRERCKQLPAEHFVALVGEMITEEALPTYQTMLNSLDGVRDETGASLTSWATWIRAWTAEENRHGDLLNKYLYLSGRVDMKQIERSIQYLIRSGMDPKFENNPYNGFVYTSFQERATFISHGNTARLVKEHGDMKLAQICGTIASDEKRHETAYTKIVEKLFEIDPDDTILALAGMMKKRFRMPGHFMYDGQDDKIFYHFSAVTQRLGVYTGQDYADILEFMIERWKVEKLIGLTSEGRKAQDFVCGLPLRIRRILENKALVDKAKKGGSAVPFGWVFGQEGGGVSKISDVDGDPKLMGMGKGLKATLGGLEELWDQSQYTEEYNLSQFLLLAKLNS